MKTDILSILENARTNKVTPGAVVGFISNGIGSVIASGRLTYDDESIEVSESTVYDVASVTKSVPLSSLIHIALQEGKLSLDTKATDFVPELVGKYHELIRLKDLLTYTAIWDLPTGLSQYAYDGADAVL